MPEPRIVLKKVTWEAIAQKVGTGISGTDAYFESFPDCKTANASYRRLIRMNPDIELRIEQIRAQVERKAINRAAMVREDVQELLLENIDHAKTYGTVIRDSCGHILSYERNYGAVNASIKLLADINGLTIKSKAKDARGERDPEALLSADQLLGQIFRRWAVQNGRGMDAGDADRLRSIAATAGSGPQSGASEPAEIEVLRSIPETESVP